MIKRQIFIRVNQTNGSFSGLKHHGTGFLCSYGVNMFIYCKCGDVELLLKRVIKLFVTKKILVNLFDWIDLPSSRYSAEIDFASLIRPRPTLELNATLASKFICKWH